MQHAGILLAEFFTIEGNGLPEDQVKPNVKLIHARMQSQRLDLHVPRL